MDGRPNRSNKAAFSNFSGAVCTGLEKSMQNVWKPQYDVVPSVV